MTNLESYEDLIFNVGNKGVLIDIDRSLMFLAEQGHISIELYDSLNEVLMDRYAEITYQEDQEREVLAVINEMR